MSTNRDDPLNIIRNIAKGFDVAYPQDAYTGEDSTTEIRGAAITDADARAWSTPKHPSKPELELLDSYPVLPDMDAIPSSACYIVTRFITNPVTSGDNYDERLDAAILRPKEDAQAYAQWKQKMADWDESSGKSQPLPEDNYEYFLPVEASAIRGIKRKLDVNDPENENDDLYADDVGEGRRAFKYTRLRTYETYNQHGDPNNLFNDSVALALHDPDTEIGTVPGTETRLAKGAYFYPIIQRTALRPKRNVGNMALSQVPDEDRIDEINLTVGEADEDYRLSVREKKAAFDPSIRADAAASVEATA